MKQRIWVIVGATSIIAEKFAHLVAQKGAQIRLVGRDKEELELRAQDIKLRYRVICEVMLFDKNNLEALFTSNDYELDLFIAQSLCQDNATLTHETIKELIDVNILTTVLMINAYLKTKQTKHHLLFLSSVAASRGRAKNSLYGGSKAAIEVYLQGLQQTATDKQHISIARLGYIDTKQTYGLNGIFFAAKPHFCAKACWKAVCKGQRIFYFPYFWHIIMAIFKSLPFYIYKKM